MGGHSVRRVAPGRRASDPTRVAATGPDNDRVISDPGARVAATAMLIGGSVAGWGIAGCRERIVTAGAAALALVGTVGLSRSARRQVEATAVGMAGQRADATVRIAVLIPARDEVAHLPALLGDLADQSARHDGAVQLRIVVIDDRSSDGSGNVATAILRDRGLDGVVIRRDGPGGKGDALGDVPVGAMGDPQSIVVLDADARVGPEFLGRVAAHVRAGEEAFTARRRVLLAEGAWLARLQDDEQALDAWILAGRSRLGGGGELRGDGLAVTPSSLTAAGGWPSGVLTEDLELSTALLTAGVPIAWAGDVVVAETGVATLRGLVHQRVRWSEGSARRLMIRLPRALTSPRASRTARLDLALYAGQLVLPPLILGALLRPLGGGRPGSAMALMAVYIAAGTSLAWRAIGQLQPPDHAARRMVRALAVGLFSTHWLVVVPVALVRIAVGPAERDFHRTRDRLTSR